MFHDSVSSWHLDDSISGYRPPSSECIWLVDPLIALAMCVAACCSVLQCVAVWCSVMRLSDPLIELAMCVAVCCSVLQCVAVWCSVMRLSDWLIELAMCVAACCSVLQCVAVWCSVMRLRDWLIEFVIFRRPIEFAMFTWLSEFVMFHDSVSSWHLDDFLRAKVCDGWSAGASEWVRAGCLMTPSVRDV